MDSKTDSNRKVRRIKTSKHNQNDNPIKIFKTDNKSSISRNLVNQDKNTQGYDDPNGSGSWTEGSSA
jgi:hypothetical protein